MNKGIFIGNLGRDADLKTIEGGTTIISFNLAIDESYKNKAGEKIQKTTWVNCSKFVRPGGSTAIAQYLTKGSKVCVEGTVSTRAWIARDSEEAKSSLECNVVNLELLGASKGAAGNNTSTSTQTSQAAHKDAFDEENTNQVAPEDDLPF